MITSYALALLLFSLTLAVLGALVYLASRRVFTTDPVLAHRFALLALGVALVALPARQLGLREFLTPPAEKPSEAQRPVEEPESATMSTGDLVGSPAAAGDDELLIEQINALRDRIAATQMALDLEATQGAGDASAPPPGIAETVELEIVPERERTESKIARLSGVLARSLSRAEVRLGLTIFVVLHALGTLVVIARRWRRFQRTREIVRRARVSADPELRRLWREIAGRRGRSVQIRISDEIDSPACFGLWRPVLILPARSLRRHDKQALSWALRHELVHIRRGDCLISPFQHLLVALAWFHPTAWWLERELVRLRELSCDHVVVRTSGARKSYALALIEFAQERGSRAGFAAPMDAPALIPWSGGKSFLQRRIEMLAHSKYEGTTLNRILRLSAMTTTCLAVWLADIGIAAALPGPQEPPAPPAGGLIIIEEPPVEEPELVDEPMEEMTSAPTEPLTETAVIAVEPKARSVTTTTTRRLATTVAPSTGIVSIAPVESSRLSVADVPGPSVFGGTIQEESPRFGVNLGDVDPTLAAQLGLEEGQGIVVESVVAKSAAEKAGLQKHDVIVRINKLPASLQVLRSERDKAAGKKPVVLEIRRRARPMTIIIWADKKNARTLYWGSPESGGGAGGGASGSTEKKAPNWRLDLNREDPRPAPADRGDYMREIEKLQRQLKELEQRLSRDPHLGASKTAPETWTWGNPYSAETARRLAEAHGKDLPAEREMEAALQGRKKAVHLEAIVRKIEKLSTQRHVLIAQLEELRKMQSRIEDENKKRAVLERIVDMEIQLNQLEAELEAFKAARKEATWADIEDGKDDAVARWNATAAGKASGTWSAESLDRLLQHQARVSAQEAQIKDLEVSLAATEQRRAELERKIAELAAAASAGNMTRDRHDALRAENAKLRDERARARMEYDEMKAQLREAMKNFERSRAEHERLKEDTDSRAKATTGSKAGRFAK